MMAVSSSSSPVLSRTTRPVLTIDLDAVAANWRALDKLSGRAETGAAVKANGYGCGAGPVVGTLTRAGCRSFFVATVDEALDLAWFQANERSDIYILGGVGEAEAKEAKTHGLIPILNHPGQIEAWRAIDGGACALQLDSGMSRLGLQPSELSAVPSGLDVQLIMTHLSCSDMPDHAMSALQLSAFQRGCAELSGSYGQARRSIGATGGTLLGKDYHLDLVRCGIGLYGGLPYAGAQPVVSLHSPILQLRDIASGDAVGYGNSWTAERPTKIATLPMGYADGFHRALSNKAKLFVKDQAVPLVGRVSMDLITVDVSSVEEIAVGDSVEIIGPNQTIDQLAEAAGTIGYELLTSLGARYERQYIGATYD